MAFAALTVDLTAKMAKFEDSMNNATRSVDKLNARTGALSAGLKTAFTGAAVLGVAAFAKSGIDAADAMGKLSARTGVAVKDLASLQLSADSADTSLDDVGKAMLRLRVSMGDAATGNKALGESLARLGITSKDPKEQIYQLADAVKNGGNSAVVASDLNKVLGRSYANLIPFLQQGGDALRDSAKASESFADAMARLSPNAEKFNDQLDSMKQNAAGFAANMIGAVLPSLNQYIGALQEILERGTLLDQIKFFTVGYINADVADKVTDYATRTAQLREELVRLQKTGGDTTEVIARLNKLYAGKVEEIQRPPRRDSLANTAELECEASGGKWDGKKCVKKKTGGSKSDPLASLLGQTDIVKMQEFDKTVALLNQRFDNGRKNTELYGQAMTKLVETTFASNWKQAADDAEFFRLVEEDGIKTTQEWRQNLIDLANVDMSRLNDMIANSDFSKLAKGQEDMVLLAKAFSDGIIDADGNLRKLSESEYLDIVANRLGLVGEAVKETKSLAEELGLSFTSAFEDAIVGGKSFSDVLKGLEQDILRIVTRKMVTEPLGNFVSGAAKNFDFSTIIGSMFASANGNAFPNGAGLAAYSGSIVSRPTVFPFAKGIGLMGEAGPEAILPLKRGSNGKLGVASEGSGGSTVVHMTINTPDANSFRASQGQITAQMTRALARGRRYS